MALTTSHHKSNTKYITEVLRHLFSLEFSFFVFLFFQIPVEIFGPEEQKFKSKLLTRIRIGEVNLEQISLCVL